MKKIKKILFITTSIKRIKMRKFFLKIMQNGTKGVYVFIFKLEYSK